MITIINFLFIVLSAITFFWLVIGVPAGIVFFILYKSEKDKKKKENYKRWIKLSWGSLISFICIFLSYFVYKLIVTLLGF
jgi:hypothetical protein